MLLVVKLTIARRAEFACLLVARVPETRKRKREMNNRQSMGKLVPDEQDNQRKMVTCIASFIDLANRIAQKALDSCFADDYKLLPPPRFVSEHSTRL